MTGELSNSEKELLGDEICIDIDSAPDTGKGIIGDEVDVEAANEKAKEAEADAEADAEAEAEVIIPMVGMKFNSVEGLFQCFKNYAQYKGFTVRKRTSKKDEDGRVSYVTFACSRGGRTDCHPTSRTGCEVKLTASYGRDNKWRINKLFLEHNHELNPSKVLLCRCYQENDEHVKTQLEACNSAGIAVEAGGHDNFSLIDDDSGNYLDMARRLRLRKGDAVAIQNYFVEMQTQNSNFFYSMDFDENGRLKNIFWADARCKEACKEFGDIITFDTTYLTNKYDLPLALFVGVNHHGQSILLGSGLISGEIKEAFVWLFRTWVVCMSGIAPQGIITDQGQALQKAIEIVLPNTKHRLCLWHLMKRFHEKFGSHNQYKSIKSTLEKVVYDTQSLQEFEQEWSMMLDKFELNDNTWLNELYKDKHRWAPYFVRTNFWAGMSATQRNENVNAFFDGYVHEKTTIKQFVEQYKLALKVKMHKENQADLKSFSQAMRCATTYDIEKQFLSVYTFDKFKEFQTELTGKIYCEIIETRESSMGLEYDIHEDIAIENHRKLLKFTVLFQNENCEVSCSCRNFDFRGILCKHALYVLTKNKVTAVPDKYIIDRWRKDVLRSYTRVRINYDGVQSTSDMLRYKKMCDEFGKVANLAVEKEDDCCSVMEWIENKMRDLYAKKHRVTLKSTSDTNSQLYYKNATKPFLKVQDPMSSKTKGPSCKKRQKSPMETSSKKSNQKRPTIEGTQDGSSDFCQQLGLVSTQKCVAVRPNLVQQSPCLPPVFGMGNMNSVWGFKGQLYVLEPRFPLVNGSYGLNSSTLTPPQPSGKMTRPSATLFEQPKADRASNDEHHEGPTAKDKAGIIEESTLSDSVDVVNEL